MILRRCVIMNTKLFIQAIVKFFVGLILVSVLIFVPAGTLEYWQGWIFIGILFVPMFIAGFVMMIKVPDLLRKRLNAKEKQDEQKMVLLLSGIMFFSAFVIAGLNFRFKWIVLPNWVTYMASGVFLIFYALYAEVLRENMYLSRTIEVQKDQKVIDDGLYGIVRHPMYMVTQFLFLSMPLMLGSIISFAIMILYVPIIVKRIKNEEKILEEDLEGYAEYKKKVKYRLMPFVW